MGIFLALADMAHSYFHAKSSQKTWGGKIEDYLPIHQKMDSTKSAFAEFSHRAIFHSAFGIFIIEDIFGQVIKNSDGKEVPVRAIAEQHCLEDHGFIPTLQDWLSKIPKEDWMLKKAKKLSKTL